MFGLRLVKSSCSVLQNNINERASARANANTLLYVKFDNITIFLLRPDQFFDFTRSAVANLYLQLYIIVTKIKSLLFIYVDRQSKIQKKHT